MAMVSNLGTGRPQWLSPKIAIMFFSSHDPIASNLKRNLSKELLLKVINFKHKVGRMLRFEFVALFQKKWSAGSKRDKRLLMFFLLELMQYT